MRYVNELTGAVIDTPCTISGGNWTEYVEDIEELDDIESVEESSTLENDEADDTIDLSKMKIAELKELANENGIELGDASKKEDIIKLIASSDVFDVE